MRIEEAWAALHDAAEYAAARGSLLFHLDLATEAARAAFAAQGLPDDMLAALVDEDGYRVVAFEEGPAPRAVAEARFDASGETIVATMPVGVPPRALTLAIARETIAAAPLDGSGPHAAIVIPAHDPGRSLEGYALAVGESADTVLIAGHWLLRLDRTGRRITAREPLAAATDPAPIDLPRSDRVSLVEAGAVPNELHTYLSLKHDVPLIVETQASGVRWRVDGERRSVI